MELTRDSIETVHLDSPDDVAPADKMKAGREKIVNELRKTIVGQDDVVGQVLLTLFVGGNSLIVGVPGLAKTLLIHTMAKVLELKFSRIQFTPDLMPSDITGTELLEEDRATGARSFRFAQGPVFANVVLADEIIACRSRRASANFNYATVPWGGPFRTWRQFYQFVDNLAVPKAEGGAGVIDDTRPIHLDYEEEVDDPSGYGALNGLRSSNPAPVSYQGPPPLPAARARQISGLHAPTITYKPSPFYELKYQLGDVRIEQIGRREQSAGSLAAGEVLIRIAQERIARHDVNCVRN